MKIIILGASQVGRSVANAQVSEANNITVADQDEQLLMDLQNRLNLGTVRGPLTYISTPELAQEQERNLLRSRQKLLDQQTELRKPIQALLRRNGRHFKTETHYKTHWSLPHYAWLDKTIEAASGSLKVNLSLLVRQLKALNDVLIEYDEQVEALARTPQYEKPVQALTCYKGIKNLFALTMITKIGDVKRFPHPRTCLLKLFLIIPDALLDGGEV
jgi:transposase